MFAAPQERLSFYWILSSREVMNLKKKLNKQELDDVLLTDLHEKSDADLRDILDQFYEEERKISYKRRILHGKIDILRAELVERLKNNRKAGQSLVSGKDIERLSKILSQGGIEFPEL